MRASRDLILDPRRIQRPQERRIEWQCSLSTRMRFRDLLNELVDLEAEPWSMEVEARMEALRDDIRHLPGYPQNYDPDRTVIVPVTTTAMR